jgi:hypothetical protein
VATNAVLIPYEQYVQREYEAEAARAVADLRPFIVGITGSYGKSSTKAILAHILQFHAPTLAATGSINTIMGVTRHIREELVPGHRYMVVEMGAFKTGSIRRLCQLTPPDAAIITAVGDMHLERFGSTDAIITAKSELAEALPDAGLLVVNADSPGALTIARRASKRRVLLTAGHRRRSWLGAMPSRSRDILYLTHKGPHIPCFTPLHGRLSCSTGRRLHTRRLASTDHRCIAARAQAVSNRLRGRGEKGITGSGCLQLQPFGFRAALGGGRPSSDGSWRRQASSSSARRRPR